MGRSPNTEPKVLVETARKKDGRTTYKSAVRYARNVRTYLGTYPTHEEAARVSQPFIDTGAIDRTNALKPGPIANLKPKKKRIDNRTNRVRTKKAEQGKPGTHAKNLNRDARIDALRRAWRATA